MQVEKETVTLTTDASGNATGFTSKPYTGSIMAIKYVKDGTNELASNATVTFTCDGSGLAIDTETIPTGGSFEHYPRAATHDVTGAAALFAAAGKPVLDKIPVASERIKIVIASGGNTKTGAFTIYVGG